MQWGGTLSSSFAYDPTLLAQKGRIASILLSNILMILEDLS